MIKEPPHLKQLIVNHQTGYGLDRRFYVDPDIFEFDLHKVYFKNWIYAGLTERIPQKGDFFVYEIAGESIIIVRSGKDRIKAFFNICRHRGTKLCKSSTGNLKRFRCPYHNWTYDLDGNLLAAKLMVEDFDHAQHALFRCHVQVVEGVIFICLNETAPSVSWVFKDIERFLHPYGLSSIKICWSFNHTVAANWKVVAENFWECYHCSVIHPEFSATMTYPTELRSEKGKVRQKSFEQRWMKSLGEGSPQLAKIKPTGESIHRCEKVPIRPGFMTQSKDGLPVAPLLGDLTVHDGGVTGIQMFPILWFSLCSDHAVFTRFTPIDTQLTEIEFTWVVRASAVEGKDFNVDDVVWLWRTTGLQDKSICELNQLGINSRKYKPGPLSKMEIDVSRFHHWYFRQILSDTETHSL